MPEAGEPNRDRTTADCPPNGLGLICGFASVVESLELFQRQPVSGNLFGLDGIPKK